MSDYGSLTITCRVGSGICLTLPDGREVKIRFRERPCREQLSVNIKAPRDVRVERQPGVEIDTDN